MCGLAPQVRLLTHRDVCLTGASHDNVQFFHHRVIPAINVTERIQINTFHSDINVFKGDEAPVGITASSFCFTEMAVPWHCCQCYCTDLLKVLPLLLG